MYEQTTGLLIGCIYFGFNFDFIQQVIKRNFSADLKKSDLHNEESHLKLTVDQLAF